MKEFNRMSDEEKESYMEKVIKYDEEVIPRLLRKTEAWIDSDLKEYYAGVELLTAWRKFSPMVDTLRTLNPNKYIVSLAKYIKNVRENSPLGQMRTISADDKRKFYSTVTKEEGLDEDGIRTSGSHIGKAEESWLDIDGRLPKELSQYKHLLSVHTQRETEALSDLYSAFTFNSEMAKNLALQGASKEEIASYSKAAVDAQNQISDLWEKVDAEKLVIEQNLQKGTSIAEANPANVIDPIVVTGKSRGAYTKDEIDRMINKVFATECRIARIEANQKYISRDDMKLTARTIAQKKLRIHELEAWGVTVDEKYKSGLNEE